MNTSSLHSSVSMSALYPSATAALATLNAPGGPSVSEGGVRSTQQGKPERITTVELGGREEREVAAAEREPGRMIDSMPRPPWGRGEEGGRRAS